MSELRKIFESIMNKDRNNAQNSIIDDNQKIIIYKGELDYLSKCILESPQVETGGNLFGLWTPFGIPFIQYVVGPGKNAEHHNTHFRQDFDFLDRNADCLVREHALHHIGTWHSHHSLKLDHPSDGDSNSTLSGMRECNLKSFILLIGNYRQGKSTINAFRYYNNGYYVKLKWIILNGVSPIRLIYDKSHSDIVYTPLIQKANMIPLEQSSLIDDNSKALQPPTFDANYWLSFKDNRKEFAIIVGYLKNNFDNVNIFFLNPSTVEVKISDSKDAYKLIFDKTFPNNPPKLLASKGNANKFKSTPKWDIDGKSISEAFINFLRTIEI